MIAKLIVHAESREEARRALALDCSFVRCWPVRCNAEFLCRALETPRFRSGDVDTNLIPAEYDSIVPDGEPSENALQSLADFVFEDGGDCPSPWLMKSGWRLNRDPEPFRLRLQAGRKSYDIVHDPGFGGSSRPVERVREGYLVDDLGSTYVFTEWQGGTAAAGGAGDGALISPMPGRVISVEVRQGEKVAKGQKLLTLEAMKMEHSLTAPFDGVVAELEAAEGAQVTEGTLLVRVEKGAET
jgi:3-methylcrotonyl-CoA carboxylase alpha subunit